MSATKKLAVSGTEQDTYDYIVAMVGELAEIAGDIGKDDLSEDLRLALKRQAMRAAGKRGRRQHG